MPAEPPRTTVHQVQHLIFDGCRILRTRAADSLTPETLAALDAMIAQLAPAPMPATAREAVAPPVVAAVAQRAGAPLEPAVREEFEYSLGHDFSSVRILDPEATRATATLEARAFTLGQHIAIKDGLYEPYRVQDSVAGP